MDALKKNMTTAEQAVAIENAVEHPFRPGKARSSRYRALLSSRRRLPISERRQDFLNVYHMAKVIILSSETGSGKTTQVPQFVFFDEFADGKRIACTQPRRLAATSVAQRVAEEMDVTLGEEVGYSIRFENKTSDKTRIVYMTDGLLLREAMNDPLFSAYSCIIIDEAHERTKSTDILMALLKKAVSKRSDFKVVIMSATLDADKFKNYFGLASTINIQGRSHPVEIYYLEEATPDYKITAMRMVKHVHESMGAGDILVFLPAADEIERVCASLRKGTTNLDIFPLYSALAPADQRKIFAPSTTRKCIISTNISETSLTIDGVVYVIDSGLCKEPSYNPRVGMNMLLTTMIPKSAAIQRTGRAGRTKPGYCFRLYTRESYETATIPSSPPGILQEEMAGTVLLLKYMGVQDVAMFDFVDPPHPELYLRAVQDLLAMNYLGPNGRITSNGQNACRLSVSPPWFNALVEGRRLGCSGQILSLAALSALQNSVFLRPHSVRYASDASRARFANPVSDHLSGLSAFHDYAAVRLHNTYDLETWCHESFLNYRMLDEAFNIRGQLKSQFLSIFGTEVKDLPFSDENYDVKIRRALAMGFYHQAAIYSPKGDDLYQTVHGCYTAGLHPDSSLLGLKHEWVIYDKLTYIYKQWMETVTAVDASWLMDLDYFQDHNLNTKRNPERTLRQPDVKISLDKARAKRAAAQSA